MNNAGPKMTARYYFVLARTYIFGNHSMVMEWLNAGQRVEHYRIEAWDGKTWKT